MADNTADDIWRSQEAKLLLVDGNDLLHQMHTFLQLSSMRDTNPNIRMSQNIQHDVFAFTGGLLKLLRLLRPSHLLVLFDRIRSNSRVAIYEALQALGIRYCEVDPALSADCIAGYALHYNYYIPVDIASADSIFLQLVNEKIHVVRFHGDELITLGPSYVRTRFGLYPRQYADFRVLTGEDYPANAKPAAALDSKTAIQLLNKFETLSNLRRNVDRIRKPALREQINQCVSAPHADDSLTRRGISAVLPLELPELSYQYTETTTSAVLEEIGFSPIRWAATV